MLVFFPLDHNGRIFARFGAYVSMLSHFLLCVYSYKNGARFTTLMLFLDKITKGFFWRKKSVLLGYLNSPVSLIFGFLCCHNSYAFFFGWVSLGIAAFFFFLSFSDLNFFLFTVCYILGVSKVFNIASAPASNITFYFVAFLFSFETYKLISVELSETLYTLIQNTTNDENLAAQIAHDIRSPMAVLRLLLSQINLKDDKQDMKEVLLNSVEQINAISKAALFKRRKQVTEKIKFARLDSLNKTIRGSQVIHREVDWYIDIDPNLVKFNFAMDALSFERVLQNLINNACEATDVSIVKIICRSCADGRKCEICIMNDGKTIPNGVLRTILESGGTYDKEDGTGLGLKFCKREIELSKGTFVLVSGEGITKVTVTLPIEHETL